ncbi:MAG: PTS sugar transporter subunit IIC [Deltaproteobacteria bacterium]|nr:PTS sugar transporter subunit IIC [Deltaproteobacteria bacterium]
MVSKSILVALVGGITCLDRTLVQAMISRPIVVGPIIGLILDDPYTGLLIGAFVELFWIDRSHIGVSIPPNDTVVAILITGTSIIAGNKLDALSRELVAFSVLLFMPFGILGQKIDIWLIRSNDLAAQQAVEDAKLVNIRGISRKHLFGLLKTFLITTAFIFISLICGIQILSWIYPHIPENIVSALFYVYFFLPVIGVAVALNTIKLRGTIPVFSGIFLIGALIIEIL